MIRLVSDGREEMVERSWLGDEGVGVGRWSREGRIAG
jgi:hypothetical protein